MIGQLFGTREQGSSSALVSRQSLRAKGKEGKGEESRGLE